MWKEKAKRGVGVERDEREAALFQQVVLTLGGVFAVRGTDDATIRQVAAGLARVWERALARGASGRPARLLRRAKAGEAVHPLAAAIKKIAGGAGMGPHPAIDALLRLVEESVRADPLPPDPATGPDGGRGPDISGFEENENDGFVRIPGLYRRWEIAQVLEAGVDYHLEEAGTTSDGGQLYAVFQREGAPREGA